jgi:hypothetical protein
MLAYKPIVVKSHGESTPFFQAHMPLAPSVNDAHIIGKKYVRGRLVSFITIAPEIRDFKQECAYTLPGQSWVDQAIHEALKASKAKKPLSMQIVLYTQYRWLGDTDNRIKYTQDACFDFLQLNDNLVDCLNVQRIHYPENPHAEVEISCYL